MSKHDPEACLNYSAAHLGRFLAANRLDPVALCEAVYARITAYADPSLFLTLTQERARREAEASAKRLKNGAARGPLDGVPIGWKDLFDMKETRTTAGSALRLAAPRALKDAQAVVNLSAAGMVSIGKLNLSEFAYSGLGLNLHFGTPRNPCDPKIDRIPGGSSSGSAVAIAAGLLPCTIGSDTGGSVRVPAALNGVIGFKTSENRIPKQGCFPLSHTLDTIGPLARSAEDCLLLETALRGAHAAPLQEAELNGVTVILAPNLSMEDVEPAVAAHYERSLSQLSAAGARLITLEMPIIDKMQMVTEKFGSMTAVEAYQIHHDQIENPNLVAQIDPRIVTRILGGRKMTGRDVIEIQQAREKLVAEMAMILAQRTLLVMPTCAHTAPEIAALDADADLYHQVNLKTLRNTMIGNFFGLCGWALPNGVDAKGLPTSIMILAAGGTDSWLLSLGPILQKVLTEESEKTLP